LNLMVSKKKNLTTVKIVKNSYCQSFYTTIVPYIRQQQTMLMQLLPEP
jgi:hypothetical protein